MYNRYIQGSRGSGTHASAQKPSGDIHYVPGSSGGGSTPPRQEKGGLLSSLFGKFHLEDIDSGDLLLIAILILLFKESEDEELLIALILLLIL